MGAVGDFQARGAGFDEAAVALLRCFCLDAAAEVQFAVVEVAEQFHFAVLLSHGVGFDVAAVADKGFFHRIGAERGEDDMAAFAEDGAAVIDQALQGAAVEGVGEAVAGQGDAEGFGGGEQDFALRRVDFAAVFNDGGDKGDHATGRNGDAAEVFDAAAGGAVEAVVARHEVFVADARGGGNQAADVDLRVFADEDAVRVLDEDVAVGVHRAFEDGALIAKDAV